MPEPTATIDSNDEPPTRRNLLRVAAATAAGAVGAATLGQPTAADNGQPVLLGVQTNTATLPTRVHNNGPFPDLSGPGPIALELESPGGHLRFIGNPGDIVHGTYPEGTLAYNASSGLEMWQFDGPSVRPTLLARAGTAGAFTLLAPPERVYDSRPGQLPASGVKQPIAAGQTRSISLLESGTEQFIENIDGAMINLTVTQTTGAGFLSIFSDELTSPPTISNVNWSQTGQTVANLAVTATRFATVKVHCGGAGAAHFIIDVLGVYG